MDSKTRILTNSIGILNNIGPDESRDLNSLTTKSGLYYFGSDINNAPQNYIIVLNIIGTGMDILQIAFPMSSAQIYRRRHSLYGWNSWESLTFT